jgi:hypothetical protein
MDRLNRRNFATLVTGLVGLALLSGCATPEPERPTAVVSTEPPPLLVRPDRPERYVVGADDNIWDISARYLDEPWRWGELWPGGDWPSIYPGDVLQFDDTQGQLQLAEGEPPTIKLTPQVRVEYIHDPVPTVTREGVLSFYDDSVVLSDSGWKSAPYIVGGADNRPLLASVYRPEGEYRHPDTNDFLGYNMVYLGQAELEDEGDPATLRLISTRREVRPGDRLLEAVEEDRLDFDFTTVPAPPDTYGRILGALGKEPRLLGRYDVVVVSLGDLDGMRQGSVLASYATDAAMTDPLTGATVDTPRERSGLVVLFKVFERASYGLVTEARREIRPGDLVREP